MAMVTVKNSAPYTDSAPLLNDPQALRQRAREEGYLHFKQLVPREDMLNVRRQVLETAQQQGWLKDGAPLMDGISKPGFFVIESREGDWQKYYQQILKLRDFHALALHPNIIDALEKLFDEAVLPHSRNICRTIFPKATRFTTPPHQDHLHIGGTEETWTVWMPLGDCPLELGGLAVAPGTHTSGLMQAQEAEGAGGRMVDVGEEATWVEGPLEAGDVLMLHSLVVHQGRNNETEDRLRLSVDYRYQPRSHPVRADSMLPHNVPLTWDQVYDDWDPTDPVKYYWRDYDLNLVSPDYILTAGY